MQAKHTKDIRPVAPHAADSTAENDGSDNHRNAERKTMGRRFP